jgi:hypothetical protein
MFKNYRRVKSTNTAVRIKTTLRVESTITY